MSAGGSGNTEGGIFARLGLVGLEGGAPAALLAAAFPCDGGGISAGFGALSPVPTEAIIPALAGGDFAGVEEGGCILAAGGGCRFSFTRVEAALGAKHDLVA